MIKQKIIDDNPWTVGGYHHSVLDWKSTEKSRYVCMIGLNSAKFHCIIGNFLYENEKLKHGDQRPETKPKNSIAESTREIVQK